MVGDVRALEGLLVGRQRIADGYDKLSGRLVAWGE